MIKAIGFTIVNFIVAVATAYAAHLKWLSEAEAVILAAVLLTWLTSAEALYYATALMEAEKRDHKFWTVRNSFEHCLTNVRAAYNQIMQDQRDTPDLFQSFYDTRMTEFESSIVEAANSDRLRIDSGHLVSMDVLLSTFRGRSEDVLRAVHLLEDNHFFFSLYAKQYFPRTLRLIESKQLKEIRRLMIYANEAELKDERSIRLMRFHALTKGYDYRLMRRETFAKFVQDSHIDTDRDFGIYGSKYVYCSHQNEIGNAVGQWSRKPQTIDKFIGLFDQLWSSPDATQPALTPARRRGEKMTIDELYRDIEVADTT